MSLVCPSCRAMLEHGPAALKCPACGRLVPTDQGFPDFVGQEDLDWGELTQEQMRDVVERARREAWYAPLLDMGAKDPFLAYYILDRSRAGWVFHCLRPSGNDVCIDLGSGWGNIAFTLAEWYKKVWSVESVASRVEFQTIRREQEGNDKLHPVRSGLLSLPFADNVADLVVCNGVLEWIGLSDFSQPVGRLQKTFLREAFRVLKPGGCLYVGIENRFSGLSLLGAKDHSGLPLTNLLPRPLADVAVRRFRPKGRRLGTRERSQVEWPDYRTYTYSLGGYQRLLREVGFSSTESRWVWPTYNSPHYSGSFDDESLHFLGAHVLAGSRNRLARSGGLLLRSLPQQGRAALAKALWPCFLLFAYKDSPRPLLRDVIRAEGPSGALLTTTTRISGPKNTFLGLGPAGVTQAMTPFKANGWQAPTLPLRPGVETRRVGDFVVLAEPGVKGRALKPPSPLHAAKAMEWLIAYQRGTAQGPLTLEVWQREAAGIKAFLAEQPEAPIMLGMSDAVLRAVDGLVQQGVLHVTAEHGDFQIRNVLVDRQGHVGVIDWDDSRPAGNPLLDIGTYLLMLPQGSVRNLADMVRGRGPLAKAAAAVLQHHQQATGLRLDAPDVLIGYALLRSLERDTIMLSAHGVWVKKPFPGAMTIAHRMLLALPGLGRAA